MKYQVPQFLDVEDKIVGPLTIKQFIYLAGGVGMGYLLWKITPIPYFRMLLGFACVGLGGMFSFYKFNGRPFIMVVEHAFDYYKSDRMFIWRKKEKKKDADLDISNFKPTKHGVGLLVPSTESKLSNLSWTIDVKQGGEVSAQKVHTDV